jgi:hypothetical protein
VNIERGAGWGIALLGVVLAVLLLSALPERAVERAQAPPPPAAGVHMGIPPREIWQGGPHPRWSTTVASGHTLHVELSVHTWFRAIELRWSCAGSAGVAQVVTLPYWPTDAIGLTDDEIVVAGKLRDGETVIETIGIAAPTQVLDATTRDRMWVASPVGARDYVYCEATATRDMVVWLRSMKRDAADLLVHFYDSGDVYRLRLATGELTLQASSTPGRGALHVPELADIYREVWGGDHRSLGHVYVLNEYGSPDAVVLIDGDRDGDIDGSVVADSATWAAMGLGDADRYSDW